MPRPNRGRSIASETNLAKRIAYERERRDLSYEGLAAQMTEHGCAIQGSAIYKIEKGDPPRRVTVDELVALARVFELPTVDELLTPVGLIEQREAKELVAELDRVTELLTETAVRMFNMFTEYGALAINNPDLHEYVDHHWNAAAEGDFSVAALTDERGEVSGDTSLNDLAGLLSEGIRQLADVFIQHCAKLAEENVTTAIETGATARRAIKAQVG
jgi:transcriptional regulator with XRE-family HTH domain